MSQNRKLQFAVEADGSLTAIYSDDMADFFDEVGHVSITRASHVEPHPDGGWIADMSPSGENVVLGPFVLRADALRAEVDWLERKMFDEPENQEEITKS